MKAKPIAKVILKLNYSDTEICDTISKARWYQLLSTLVSQ